MGTEDGKGQGSHGHNAMSAPQINRGGAASRTLRRAGAGPAEYDSIAAACSDCAFCLHQPEEPVRCLLVDGCIVH